MGAEPSALLTPTTEADHCNAKLTRLYRRREEPGYYL